MIYKIVFEDTAAPYRNTEVVMLFGGNLWKENLRLFFEEHLLYRIVTAFESKGKWDPSTLCIEGENIDQVLQWEPMLLSKAVKAAGRGSASSMSAVNSSKGGLPEDVGDGDL